MKTLTFILSLIISSVALAEEPAKLVKLRKTWENSQAEAKKKAEEIYRSKNTKANKLYYAELQQMKNNFMEAKNLEGAVAVNAEIEKLKALHGKQKFEVPKKTEGKTVVQNKSPLNGVWHERVEGGAVRFGSK